jgi:hypothetical protein
MAKLNNVKVIDVAGGEVMKVAYDGAEYVKDGGIAQVGDVILAGSEMVYDTTPGAYYEVVELDSEGDSVIFDDVGDRHIWSVTRYTRLRKDATQVLPTLESRVDKLEATVYKTPESELKVGDYARVIKSTCGREGVIVEIIAPSPYIVPRGYLAIKEISDGGVYRSVPEWLVRATDEEVAAAKAPKFSVGDYAKVIGETHCRDIGEGTLVEITKDLDDDGEYEIYPLDGSDYDYAKPARLEKLSDEEVAEAKAVAKWDAIGRKPNEFKKGDIVRVTKSASGHLAGTIGELVAELSSNGDHRVYANGRTYSHSYELITPVEARFDRQ